MKLKRIAAGGSRRFVCQGDKVLSLKAYLIVVVCVLPMTCNCAIAHDTGFGHSRRTLLVTMTPADLLLEYRITASPDEALIEVTLIDADGDGRISESERDSYFNSRSRQLADNLDCRTAAGERLTLAPAGYGVDHSLTQTFRFHAATSERELRLVDRNFPHKPGHVRVIAGPGAIVELLEAVDLSHTERVPLKISRAAR